MLYAPPLVQPVFDRKGNMVDRPRALTGCTGAGQFFKINCVGCVTALDPVASYIATRLVLLIAHEFQKFARRCGILQAEACSVKPEYTRVFRDICFSPGRAVSQITWYAVWISSCVVSN